MRRPCGTTCRSPAGMSRRTRSCQGSGPRRTRTPPNGLAPPTSCSPRSTGPSFASPYSSDRCSRSQNVAKPSWAFSMLLDACEYVPENKLVQAGALSDGHSPLKTGIDICVEQTAALHPDKLHADHACPIQKLLLSGNLPGKG